MSARARGAERGRTLDVLEKRVEELRLLHETAVQLTSLREIRSLLPEMVEHLRRVLEVQIVSIMLLDEESATLSIAASAGLPEDIVKSARVALGDGISGQVAEQGQPILIRDMSAHPQFARSPYHAQYTTESLICVPLRLGDRVLGVINVNNKLSGDSLDEQDLSLVTTFSAQAVLAMENARLYGNLEAEVARVTAELKRNNDELRRMQEFNSSILRYMGSGLVTLDLDERVLMLNRAAEEMLGISSADAEGRPIAWLFGPDAARCVTQEPGDESSQRLETVAHPPRGGELLIGYSTSPRLEADGRAAGTIVLFRDLTQLKKMEAELIRMDRMASLGILGAGLAHEIRNPLAAIRFNLGFLQEEEGDRPELGVIVKNVDRLDDLVKKLLRFARPQVASVRAQPLNPRVEAVAALISKQAAADGVEVHCEVDDVVGQARIDGPQVEQVVLNVALNGIQAMADGGRLLLQTRPGKAEHEGWAEVHVTDEGPGISPEALEKIFDPFFTTRESGTGLGLAVAHRIVQDHGGYVEITTPSTGRGTTFVLGFPSVEQRSGAPDGEG